MMKRSHLALPLALVCCLGYRSATPAGQPPTLSSDLVTHAPGAHKHRIIVQGSASALEPLRKGLRGQLRRNLASAVAIDVTDAQLAALKQDPLVSHISGDLPVVAHMAITNRVTAADAVWQGIPRGALGLGGAPGHTGTGVGVAILDSGIAAHHALDSRVVARVNMVADEPGVTGDPFGHGTHLAGIIGGNRTAASSVTAAFAGGSAPSVRLIDVRVLGSNGTGRTSDVIAGIDWVIANQKAHKIKVINLSLGHPVTEPSATDPLCQAVARAVAAGITVAVSAGNDGLSSTGKPVLGGITSPGNSPLALTVGALDPQGTVDPADDTVAPFSSRGPARYETVVKPDVVAPGTRVVSLQAQNSSMGANYRQYYIAGSAQNAYLRLSGTSMSTAVVSGGIALLLDAQPSLTPAQVKVAIQMGARFMPNEGLIGAGAGSVNFSESMKVAKSGAIHTLLTPASSLLGLAPGATFVDHGTLIDRLYDRTGIHLLGVLDVGPLVQDAAHLERGVLKLVGPSNPLGQTAANHLVWGRVAGWSSSYYVVWGNTIQAPSGQYVVWGNADTDTEYVVWGNADTESDYVVWGNSLPGGGN